MSKAKPLTKPKLEGSSDWNWREKKSAKEKPRCVSAGKEIMGERQADYKRGRSCEPRLC